METSAEGRRKRPWSALPRPVP